MLSLVVHHNIHLTREQRYALHNREKVECVGVAIPVWVSGGVTSEPAKEIFCRYEIFNTGEKAPLRLTETGFEVVIPTVQPVPYPQSIDDDTWRQLTPEERDELANLQQSGSGSQNLLDVRDGGSAVLMYREHSKLRSEGYEPIAIVHLVQIRAVEELVESLTAL